MSSFEDWAKYNKIEKIREFSKSLRYELINDSSSKNQKFENKSNVIIFKKMDYKLKK